MPKENQDGTEKTEKPTPRRQEKARQEGNVARSMEANSAAVLIAGVGSLILFGGWVMSRLKTIAVWVFTNLGFIEVSPATLQQSMNDGAQWMLRTLLPIMATVAIVGLAVNLLQVGFLWTTKALKPKLDKLNPLKGAKRLVNQRAFVTLLTNLVKIVVIGWVSYTVVKDAWPQFVPLMDQEVDAIFLFLVRTVLKLLLTVLLAMVFIAIIDFAYQRYKHIEGLKMTKQEVKDERKMTEGDPKVKQKIREVQFQIAFNRMIKELPDADVVITNPVHVAVALKYDNVSSDAPIVLGKGLRKLAERIKAIAAEHDIPLVENPPLARALYKACDIGDEIPGQFYQDVAEILAYIYQLKGEAEQ
jgi:flagellar biosynthetic protein FlhB